MDKHDVTLMQEAVWDYYARHGRHDMLWRQPDARGVFNPYYILVSELMLQQTQVARVMVKFDEFIRLFPTSADLARAELGSVLTAWQGLGYNRRAKFLWQAARLLESDFGGIFPQTISELVKLPGVGKNTAGAIMAYSWSIPVVFIETNIRTVCIYHCFKDSSEVQDTDIYAMMAKALPEDATATREWYWALMDYGVHVKRTQGNLNKLSKTYTKQSSFKGSLREVRGKVLRVLVSGPLSLSLLSEKISDDRLPAVLQSLVTEGLVQKDRAIYKL